MNFWTIDITGVKQILRKTPLVDLGQDCLLAYASVFLMLFATSCLGCSTLRGVTLENEQEVAGSSSVDVISHGELQSRVEFAKTLYNEIASGDHGRRLLGSIDLVDLDLRESKIFVLPFGAISTGNPPLYFWPANVQEGVCSPCAYLQGGDTVVAISCEEYENLETLWEVRIGKIIVD